MTFDSPPMGKCIRVGRYNNTLLSMLFTNPPASPRGKVRI